MLCYDFITLCYTMLGNVYVYSKTSFVAIRGTAVRTSKRTRKHAQARMILQSKGAQSCFLVYDWAAGILWPRIARHFVIGAVVISSLS